MTAQPNTPSPEQDDAAPAQASATLATLPSQQPAPSAAAETITTWPVAAHLSPVAVFEPGRVEICTYYQLFAIDNSPAAGHMEASLQHLRAAVGKLDNEDFHRTHLALQQLQSEIFRIAKACKIGL